MQQALSGHYTSSIDWSLHFEQRDSGGSSMVVPVSNFCEKLIRNKAVLVIWPELQDCTIRDRSQLGKLTSNGQRIKWVRPYKLGFVIELEQALLGKILGQ